MEARKLATQENEQEVTKESRRRTMKKWKQEIAYHPRKNKKMCEKKKKRDAQGKRSQRRLGLCNKELHNKKNKSN